MKNRIAIIILLTLTACSNSPVVKRKGMIENTEIILATSQEEKPAWIVSTDIERSNYPGYVLVVGEANQNESNYNSNFLRKAAENDGKARLSSYLGEQIKTNVESNTTLKNGNVTSTASQSFQGITNNYLEKAEALESYFEKIKIYRNDKWETVYNYYVLYGVPFEKNANKKKTTKNIEDLKLTDSQDSIKKIKEMENMIEEMNRNGIFASVSGGFSGYSLSGFKTSESEVDILQPGISGGMIFDGDIGWEKYRTSYYGTAGIYTNSPLTIIRGGVGIAKKFANIGPISLKGLGDINMIYASGKVAQLNQNMEIGSKNYSAESSIQGTGTSFGFGGGIKAEYNISSNFLLFGTARYNYYMPIDNLNLIIKDKFNGNQEAKIKLNSFNPYVDMSGMEFKGGIQFQF